LWLPRELFDKRLLTHTLLDVETLYPEVVAKCCAALHDRWRDVQVYLAQTMIAVEFFRGAPRMYDPRFQYAFAAYGIIVSSTELVSAADVLLYGSRPPKPSSVGQSAMLTFYSERQAALSRDKYYIELVSAYLGAIHDDSAMLHQKLFTIDHHVGAGLHRVWNSIAKWRRSSKTGSVTIRIDASCVVLPPLVIHVEPNDPVIKLYREQPDVAFVIGVPICSISPLGKPRTGCQNALFSEPQGFYLHWHDEARQIPNVTKITSHCLYEQYGSSSSRRRRLLSLCGKTTPSLLSSTLVHKSVGGRVLALFDLLADSSAFETVIDIPENVVKRPRIATSSELKQ
jgi:hypothetical protein